MNTDRIKKIMATLALVVSLSVVADSGHNPKFSEVDSNGDGAVTIKEAVEAGVPEKEAKRQDVDEDGELSKAEWEFIRLNRLE